jgi:hypothetical protein
MTSLVVLQCPWHTWPRKRTCSVCRNHNLVNFPFMTYHRVCNKIILMSPPVWGSCFSVQCFSYHCLSFCSFCLDHCIVCPFVLIIALYVLLSWPLYCMSFCLDHCIVCPFVLTIVLYVLLSWSLYCMSFCLDHCIVCPSIYGFFKHFLQVYFWCVLFIKEFLTSMSNDVKYISFSTST